MNQERLPQLRLSQPCHKRWDELAGSGDTRYCDACRLHVHNLSALTRAQAEAFLAAARGRQCIYFQRRADGSVVTAKSSRAAGWLLAGLSALAAGCTERDEPAPTPQPTPQDEQALLEELVGYGYADDAPAEGN